MRDYRRLIGALVVAAACGPLHRADTGDAFIIFKNESLNQANVYAARAGGPDFRIGTVLSNQKATLRVPSTVLGSGDVVIIARTVASNRTPRTGTLPLSAGDTLEVTLPVDERVLTVLPPRTP